MNKCKITKKCDAVLYSMPSLEEDINYNHQELLPADAEDIQRQAYEEGFAAGEKAGFLEGEQKANVLLDRLEKIIQEIVDVKENLTERTESQIVDLAIAVARKIISAEIKTKPEIVVSIVREAIKKLQKTGNITIKINPALYDLFMKNKSELIDIHQDVIFDVDSGLPVEGTLVVSQAEEVITNVDELVENIKEELNGGMKKQKSEAEIREKA